MNREHRLQYCKICKNQSMDLKKGLVCGLTNERATFGATCPDFERDELLADKERQKLLREQLEPEAEKSGGISTWGVIAIILLVLRIVLRLMRH